MTAPSVTVNTTAHDPAVWDRVWQREVPVVKDDAILDRERRGPRWKLVRGAVTGRFGSFRGLRCIELGSGRGDLSVLMAEQGANVTLFDYSDTALDAAQRRFDRLGLQAEFLRGDFLNDRSVEDSFDVASSLGVIEHFRGDDRTRTVRAHLNALRPGGLAVISVPHAACIPYRIWKFYLERRGRWPYGTELPYSKTELGRRCVQAGFEEVALHTFGFWQSVGDHWVKQFTPYRPDWSASRSIWDRWMGLVLLAMAWKASDSVAPQETD
ncbi:MAG: class I SAM-dependent methyltransferase [Phycisphaerae bacterium]|nr:class I SAM-dependent methyltransferase [Phycisphaerae bacterium]